MISDRTVKVTLPQSEANSPAASTLPVLLAQHPDLQSFNSWKRLSGGYGPCSIYLGSADFGSGEALNPWIIKFGPADEIRSENDAHILAKSYIPQDNLAGHIATYVSDDFGVLIYDLVGYKGEPPIDFAAAIGRIEAPKAAEAIASLISNWSAQIKWRTDNLTAQITKWVAPKLETYPSDLLALSDTLTINSPDFAAAYSNPLYYLKRGLRRTELKCPFGFTHGDLNLRNILFHKSGPSAIQADRPIIIDCRYGSVEQYSVLDFAKLEACLRYQLFNHLDSYSSVEQAVLFLTASRAKLFLDNPPEGLSDKNLQELWRACVPLRSAASSIFSQNQESELVYWGALLAYALSSVNYNLSLASRNLAFLDAAAILTDRFQPRDASAPQQVLRIHGIYSPPVVTEAAGCTSVPPLLLDAIIRHQCVLVIGSNYGRSSGFESVTTTVQHIYVDILKENAPSTSMETNLQVLARRAPRHEIVKAIRKSVGSYGPSFDKAAIRDIPATAYIALLFSDEPYIALSETQEVLRIDSVNDAVAAIDSITDGKVIYFPFYGDALSPIDTFGVDMTDRLYRRQMLDQIKVALDRRQRPISLLFWKCEDISGDSLGSFREFFSASISVPVDCYFLSDQAEHQRDAVLDALDFTRIRCTLKELSKALSDHQNGKPPAQLKAITYSAKALTHGLLSSFDEAGSVTVGQSNENSAFLLGAPPSIADFSENRVVIRQDVLGYILPAVRSISTLKSAIPSPILLSGRAGSGVTTVLTMLGISVLRDLKWPVFVMNLSAWITPEELSNAGSILAEFSKRDNTPVLLLIDTGTWTAKDLGYLLTAAAEFKGEIVPVLGGRKDILTEISQLPWAKHARRIDIEDSLNKEQWGILAQILQANGYCLNIGLDVLQKRLSNVGYLLPAIYEATDGRNRKFREIVAYEYGRYSSNQLVQRAYRLICYLGAFDRPIGQYWLLKALGSRGVSDGARILNALADDIVKWDSSGDFADILVKPRHRIIAEEVLTIAVPDPTHRLADWRDIFATANLGSRKEGSVVADLLSHRGPFIQWVRNAFQPPKAADSRIEELYKTVLDNIPIHPSVELTIRQHFALTLRYHRKYEDALDEIRKAMEIDENNVATIHIMGLVHEARATRAWRDILPDQYSRDSKLRDDSFARALANEADAAEFFLRTRERQPYEEYGYVSEARYYNKKFRILRDAKNIPELTDSQRESKYQLYTALTLIQSAESRIPKERRKELFSTKATLLGSMGNISAAFQGIEKGIENAVDPVARSRLRRAAATLAAELKEWDRCHGYCTQLIEDGEHDASLYLMNDQALASLFASPDKRWSCLRESIEIWNRNDVQTLLRAAILMLYRGDWSGALLALQRADKSAQLCEMTIYSRDELIEILKADGPYSALPLTVEGQVLRMWRPYEGLVSSPWLTSGIWFRLTRDEEGNIGVADSVSYQVGVRIRGLRAICLRSHEKAQ